MGCILRNQEYPLLVDLLVTHGRVPSVKLRFLIYIKNKSTRIYILCRFDNINKHKKEIAKFTESIREIRTAPGIVVILFLWELNSITVLVEKKSIWENFD